MGWTHVEARPGMGLEEQHLLQWRGVTVCSLKPVSASLKTQARWHAILLNPSLIGVTSKLLYCDELCFATKICETELERLGWSKER